MIIVDICGGGFVHDYLLESGIWKFNDIDEENSLNLSVTFE